MSLLDKFKGWSIFTKNRDPTLRKPSIDDYNDTYMTIGSSKSPTRPKVGWLNDRSIIASIYTRIAIDCSNLLVRHVRLDEKGMFKEVIRSNLNDCLTIAANKDQSGRAFMMDVVLSLLDEGAIAIIPTDASVNPLENGFDSIRSLRVCKITDWYPEHIRVKIYDDVSGHEYETTIPKKLAAIVENPFYAVMNEYGSISKQLINKLNHLDIIDDISSSGNLDVIIHFPFSLEDNQSIELADKRLKAIEKQLNNSKYGIAYAGGMEKITQLNRPAENQRMEQVTYLTNMLYSQLGMSEEIFNGSADEKIILNYTSRTVKPIINAVVDSLIKTFLTKTARSQGQSIMAYRDPFALMTVKEIAEVSDPLVRNEIFAPNDFRGVLQMIPSTDPRANELHNPNIAPQKEEIKSKEEIQ